MITAAAAGGDVCGVVGAVSPCFEGIVDGYKKVFFASVAVSLAAAVAAVAVVVAAARIT